MRNQYKILSEKYKLVNEDGESEKEQILGGLDFVADYDISVYVCGESFCRGEYEFNGCSVMNTQEINEMFFNPEAIEYYREFSGWPEDYDIYAFIGSLKSGKVLVISGEESSNTFCLDKKLLQAEVLSHLNDMDFDQEDKNYYKFEIETAIDNA